MHRLAILALATTVLGFTASGAAPDADTNLARANFVNAAAQAGMMEIEAAGIALNTSRNIAVKDYAYRMIADHQRMNEDLTRIAQKREVAFPSQLDADHAPALQSLRDESAATFDVAYLTQEIQNHARAAEFFKSNVLNVDPELAIFSSYNFPRVTGHQRVAEELKAALKK